MSDAPRQGWRWFKCEYCGIVWRETTRDALSPSVESCPGCNADCRPEKYMVDETIEVDEMRNLTAKGRVVHVIS